MDFIGNDLTLFLTTKDMKEAFGFSILLSFVSLCELRGERF
jgi:hypothetical protein